MTEKAPNRHLLDGTAIAVSAVDQCSDQPVSAISDDEPDSGDNTTILQGAAAFMGKASWSASRVAQVNETLALYETDRKMRLAREEQEARELAHLMEWNTQMTVVGGVQMTNAEAQAARRRVLANADVYADRAISNGEIDESDRENFKRWMARKIELEDKRGRGTITEAEAKEEADGDRTRVGHAFNHAAAENHLNSAPSVSSPARDSSVAASQPLEDYALFQAAPRDTRSIVAAGSVPIAASVKATGLDL